MIFRRIVQSTSLAFVTAYASATSAFAETPIDLKSMGEGTSLRVACGPGFSMNQNVSNSVFAADITSAYMGTALFCLLVAVALRCLPPAQRAACWVILRRTAKIYFMCGPISAGLTILAFFILGAGYASYGITMGLWVSSALITAGSAVGQLRADWKLLKQTRAARKLAKAQSKQQATSQELQPALQSADALPVVVSVEENTIIFRRADGTETRMVYPADECPTSASEGGKQAESEEREACLTR